VSVPTGLPKQPFASAPAYRLIPSKYPTIEIFDDVSNHDRFEALYRVNAMINPRIRELMGELERVPPSQRPYGIRGFNYAMGPFVHLRKEGSRFGRGEWGVLYAGDTMDTAIAEVRYHIQRYLRRIEDVDYDDLQHRGLKVTFSADLLDIRDHKQSDHWHHPDDYGPARELGDAIKKRGDAGVVFHSVRREGGTCYGLFSPRFVEAVVQAAHFTFTWTGSEISGVKKVTLAGK